MQDAGGLDRGYPPALSPGMKLRMIIVDDERLARTRLRRMLEKDPEVEIAGRMRGWRWRR